MPRAYLSRFRNQKRIIVKKLPITSQSVDNSLKDWKIVIYFYKNWPSQAEEQILLKKALKWGRFEKLVLNTFISLIIIGFLSIRIFYSPYLLVCWSKGLFLNMLYSAYFFVYSVLKIDTPAAWSSSILWPDISPCASQFDPSNTRVSIGSSMVV